MNPGPRRALLSVHDKRELVPFARALLELGFELISTGGTYRALTEAKLAVREVSALTGFPELLEGRVKTLHPVIHAGLLHRGAADAATLAQHGIEPIQLLVVNLYPFAQTIAREGVSTAEAIEQIDIGGPAMLRAAAKNHEHVTVVVDPEDYREVLEQLRQGGPGPAQRRALAAKVYAHTARYDGLIAEFLGARIHAEAEPEFFPPSLHLSAERVEVLRYGENPHQRGALYRDHAPAAGSVVGARLLQGKSLSFNNLADAEAAFECVKQFDEPACVIVKHANPCGVALGATLLEAYERAYATDPISAFGGVIAFNHALDVETARAILARQFVEVVIAPEVGELALVAFASKPNVRVLASGAWPRDPEPMLDFKRLRGGWLVQQADYDRLDPTQLKVVTQRTPQAAEYTDLVFAWKVAMYVKSNAIVYARHGRTLGIGAGQMSRVDSARLAALKAEQVRLELRGAVLASDAFFPFRDGIDAAAAVGIRAVIQPGGSMRDEEVIRAADEHGIAMLFTGIRHFRH